MKDTDYIGEICKDFNILSSYAHTKKYQSKKTYKELYEELYEELKEDEILIKKAQEILVDKTGKDIYKCNCFIGKNKRQLAVNFINSLFGTDTSKPIHKGIVKRCKAILEFLGKQNEKLL